MFRITFARKAIKNGISSILNMNNTAIKVTGVGEKLSEAEKVMTKYIAATTGAAGFGKGAYDTLDAIKCQDGVCAIISGIGCGADGIQVIGSLVPGPNITSIITTPVSVGCKVFVWCCKKGQVLWLRGC